MFLRLIVSFAPAFRPSTREPALLGQSEARRWDQRAFTPYPAPRFNGRIEIVSRRRTQHCCARLRRHDQPNRTRATALLVLRLVRGRLRIAATILAGVHHRT